MRHPTPKLGQRSRFQTRSKGCSNPLPTRAATMDDAINGITRSRFQERSTR